MRKKSMRLVSAALAACMMMSVLPVGAFALDVGAVPESSVSTQAAAVWLKAGDTIDDTNNTGNYIMKETYAKGITIDTKGDVSINIDADVDFTSTASGSILIDVKNVGKLRINNNGHTVKMVPTASVVLLYVESSATGADVEVSGGNYITGKFVTFGFEHEGTAKLKNITVTDAHGNVVQNNGADVTIQGGVYRQGSNGTLLQVFFNRAGTMKLIDNVEAYGTAQNNSTIYISGGEVTIDSGNYYTEQSNCIYMTGGRLITNGGTYNYKYKGVESSGKPTVYVSKGAEVYIHGGTFTNDGASGQVIANLGTLTIDEKSEKTWIENTKGTKWAIANLGTLYFNAGTVYAPNAGAMAVMSDNGQVGSAEITGGTITDSKYGIGVYTPNVVLKDTTFKNNENDIYLGDDQKITIDENYTGTATVGCADAAADRKITTDDTGDYQHKWKLVSADDKYIVDYKKDETTGKEYRYLNTRDENSFVVAAENATATAVLTDGEPEQTLYSFTQVPAGTEVTLTADAAPDGWVFAGWQVTKPLSGLDLPANQTVTFTVNDSDVVVSAQYEYVGTDIGDGGAGGAIAAVAVGAAAAWGVYEAGTGIYRVINMPGIAMPSNRGELAMLIWEKAGKPEPASTALYDDIDEENTDLQKAAHWMVEQGLMDEKADNTFKPNTHVTKLRTCTTWEKAKQKGLFDKTEE